MTDTEREGYTTKELTAETLRDFEKLFETHPAPGAFRCWCMYHHQSGSGGDVELDHPRVGMAKGNRERKRDLVRNDRSHGILVYWEGEPVGWCQYGLMDELPRFDGSRGYRRPVQSELHERLWRITCFTVDRRYRRRGVARAALKAALEGIRRRGGGVVEAYPIVSWGAYREYLGTASMFRREGFEVASSFGKSNVIMRKTV